MTIFKAPQSNTTKPSSPTSPYESVIGANTTSSGSVSKTYKDGTYVAVGDYMAPSGPESVNVSLTVSGGNVSAVNVSGSSSNRTASRYIQAFESGISSVIVGKPLDQALVQGQVNGSSLTPNGFNSALQNIIQQASN